MDSLSWIQSAACNVGVFVGEAGEFSPRGIEPNGHRWYKLPRSAQKYGSCWGAWCRPDFNLSANMKAKLIVSLSEASKKRRKGETMSGVQNYIMARIETTSSDRSVYNPQSPRLEVSKAVQFQREQPADSYQSFRQNLIGLNWQINLSTVACTALLECRIRSSTIWPWCRVYLMCNRANETLGIINGWYEWNRAVDNGDGTVNDSRLSSTEIVIREEFIWNSFRRYGWLVLVSQSKE